MSFIKIKNISTQHLIFLILILFAFTLPLSRAAVSSLPIILLLVWIFKIIKEKKISEYFTFIYQSKSLFIFILFSLFALSSLLWSDMSGGAYKSIYRLYIYALIIPVVMVTTSSDKDKHMILTAFFAGMFISEILSYGIYFDLLETNTSRKSAFPVPFMSHIQYSTFLAIIASLLLIRFFSTDQMKIKVFYGFYLMLVVGNLFISGGRTGQLAFLSAIIVITLMSFKHKLKAFLIAISIIFSILFIAYNTLDAFQERANLAKNDLISVYEKQHFCSSWGIRLGSYEVAYDLLKQAPFIGHGLHGHNSALNQLVDTQYPERTCIKKHGDFQNNFLLIIVQFGMIGFLLYFSFFWTFMKEKNVSIEFQKLKYIFITVFFIFFISEGLIYQFSNALFAFLLALSLNTMQSKSNA